MVEAPYTGMGHQSAIAIGNEYGKHNRRGYDRCDYDYLLVREPAHEQWGNSVVMSEIADAWNSEVFFSNGHESHGGESDKKSKKDCWKYFNSKGEEIRTDSIHSVVNTPPHYFGGEESMYVFIKKRLPGKLPDNRPDQMGSVFISFLVTPNG